MGTFMGHVIPGVCFFVMGFWCNISAFLKYYHSRRKKTEFLCTPTYRFKCLCCRGKKYEIEGVVKIILSTIGLLGELITGFRCVDFCDVNAHHITMYFFFALNGVIDLLVHHQVPLPDNIQYCFALLAFTIEGILFKFHLHGRSEMDIHVHILLVYTIGMCILTLAAEMRFRRQPMSMMARAWAIMYQGTWFIHVGYILYPPFREHSGWQPNNHEHMMLVTLIFAWHAAVNALLMLLTALVVACIKGSGRRDDSRYHTLDDLKSKGNGHALLKNNDESDLSETEFQQNSPA